MLTEHTASRDAAFLVALAQRLQDSTVDELVQTMLALSGSSGQGGHSSLNANGSPLQLCLTLGARRQAVRFIADPASHLSDPIARAHAARVALHRLISFTGSDEILRLADATWDLLLPSKFALLRRYVEGIVWLGATTGSPGCAAYIDATKEPQELAWARIAHWLTKMTGGRAHGEAICARLRDVADPMCAGFEGVTPEQARLKIYWRLRANAPLAAFGIELFSAQAMLDFLRSTIGDREISGEALVFAVGISPETGAIVDVKIDVCNHCAGLANESALTSLLQLTTALDVSGARPALETLCGSGARLSFAGFGLGEFGPRLNLYYGAPW